MKLRLFSFKAKLVQPESWVKLVFIAVVVVFPLQYYFARTYGEPYPALMMPGFEGSHLNAAGQVVMEDADVVITFDNGQTQTISMRALFAEAPSSHFQVMAINAFKPKPRVPPDDIWGKTPLKQFIYSKLMPGIVLGRIRHKYWTGVESDVALWLRDRVQRLYPNDKPVKVQIVWYKDLCSWHDGESSRQRTLGTVVEVQ